MKSLHPLDTLQIIYGVDLYKDSFLEALETLASSGRTAFRLSWRAGATAFLVFDDDAAKALGAALDEWLEKLENNK